MQCLAQLHTLTRPYGVVRQASSVVKHPPEFSLVGWVKGVRELSTLLLLVKLPCVHLPTIPNIIHILSTSHLHPIRGAKATLLQGVLPPNHSVHHPCFDLPPLPPLSFASVLSKDMIAKDHIPSNALWENYHGRLEAFLHVDLFNHARLQFSYIRLFHRSDRPPRASDELGCNLLQLCWRDGARHLKFERITPLASPVPEIEACAPPLRFRANFLKMLLQVQLLKQGESDFKELPPRVSRQF